MTHSFLEFKNLFKNNTLAGKCINSGNQADIILYDSPYGAFVHKRPSKKNRVFYIVNNVLLKREYQTLKLLQDISCIPRVYDYDYGIFMDYYPCKNLREYGRNNNLIPPNFFNSLLRTLTILHQRGIAHCDLKRKENILVQDSGDCLIIDFGVCIYRSNFFFKPLFKLFTQSDLNAYIKLKYGNKFNLLSKEDQSIYRLTTIEKLLKMLRRLLRRFC